MTENPSDLPTIPPGVHHLTKNKEVKDAVNTVMALHLLYDHENSPEDIKLKLGISDSELSDIINNN